MSQGAYYPRLSNIVQLDQLPDELSFLHNGLMSFFEHLYYRNYQVVRSADGVTTSAYIEIVLNQQLGFELPGTGLEVCIRPTIISISFSFSWGILRIIRGFNTGSFNFSDPESNYDLLTSVSDMPNEELLIYTMGLLIDDPDPAGFLINHLNTNYGTNIPAPPNTDFDIFLNDVLAAIETSGNSLPEIVYNDFINDPNNAENTTENIARIFGLNEANPVDVVKKAITPTIYANAGTSNLGICVVIPRNVLLPLLSDQTVDPDPNAKLTLELSAGNLSFQVGSGLRFNEELSFSFAPPHVGGLIGKTGISIGFDKVFIDFRKDSNIPAADAAGFPPDFMGAFIPNSVIGLPSFWTVESNQQVIITGKNLLIGTGGISGKIGLQNIDPENPDIPPLPVNLGGFSVGLLSFDITLRNNAIVDSNIWGYLSIPGFKDATGETATIQIVVHFDSNGEWFITASETQGIQLLRIPDVCSLNLASLTVGKRDDRFYVAVSGTLDFEFQSEILSGDLPTGIQIQKLLIWEDGGFEFEGGGLVLPKAVTLQLGPVKLSVTAIHIGSHEQEHGGAMRKYKYFGFDGGISIQPGGIDARGDGIKFYYTVDGPPRHTFVRIQSIAIDLIIPGNVPRDQATLLLNGYLSMKNPGNETGSSAQTEYAGGVGFKLNKLNIGGSAKMRYNPAIPSFLVDVGVELAVPIPLGSTGLSVYAFRGLVGKSFVPGKEYIGLKEDDYWYLYYKAKTPPDNRQGVTPAKFEPKGGFSLGAGVSLATSAGDSGLILSTKLFFLLGLPNVFLLEGQAQVLKKRVSIEDPTDPPFYAFIVLDPTGVQAAFGVNYKMPEDSGGIATLDGLIEMAFFFGNSQGWFINLGRDLPVEKRIRARILSFIEAYTYLMLSSSGIRFGAGAELGVDKKFGPVKVKLQAYLDVAGKIAFKPKQMGGSIEAGAVLDVSVFGVGVGLSLLFGLSAEAAKPFIIAGFAEVSVKLLFIEKKVGINFVWNFSNDYLTTPIDILDEISIGAVNIHTLESFTLDRQYFTHAIGGEAALPQRAIPMDCFVDVEFKYPVNPINTKEILGGVSDVPEFSLKLAPQKAKAKQVKHEFYVESVSVDPFEPAPPNLLDEEYKLGYWQRDEGGRYTKIRLLAQQPFSYVEDSGSGGSSWAELSVSLLNIFCEQTARVIACISLPDLERELELDNGFTANIIPTGIFLYSHGATVRLLGQYGSLIEDVGFGDAVAIPSGQSLEILFDEPTVWTSLRVGTNTNEATVIFYKRVFTGQNDGNGLPKTEYEITGVQVVPPETPLTLEYNNPAIPIDRILITPGSCRVKPDDGFPTAPNLPCSLKLMIREIGGLLHGIATHGQLALPSAILLSDPDHLPRYYKYLLVSSFQLCGGQSGNPPTGNPLIDCLAAAVPPVRYSWSIGQNNTLQMAIEALNCLVYNVSLDLATNGMPADPRFITGMTCWTIDEIPDENGCYHISTLISTATHSERLRGKLCPEVRTLFGDEITSRCKAWFYGLCHLKQEDYLYNELISDFSLIGAESAAELSGGIPSGFPVWQPDRLFKLKIAVLDRVYPDSSDPAVFDDHLYEHSYAFRTSGPPGFFHKDAAGAVHPAYAELEAKDQEDQFRYKNLLPYINFKASYPNADGRLTNAKPLFYRSPALYLFFKQEYLYAFYNWEGYAMEVVIKDPAELHFSHTGPTPCDPQIASPAWELVDTDVAVEESVIQGLNCITVATTQTYRLMARFPLPDLRPLKCYTAVFNALKDGNENDKREVHRYVFETSRYGNFSEQIQSFYLEDKDGNQGNALFTIEQALPSTAIQDAIAVLNDAAPDALVKAYMAKYDRLVFGALQIRGLSPALGTEINIVRNGPDGQIAGLLVRNPEPFNDPKIPAEDLEDTISGSMGGAAFDQAVFSEDGASVFLTNGSMNFPSGAINLTFTLKRYEPVSGTYVNAVSESLTV
jgi:hypothetical protein